MSTVHTRARFAVLAVSSATVVVLGWLLVVRDVQVGDGYATPALLTGAALAMVIPGLAAEWRRPNDSAAWLVVIVGAATALADMRLLRNSVAATVGAVAFLAFPLVVCHLLLALPDGLRRGQRTKVVAACWLAPTTFAVAMVALSGPKRTTDDLRTGGLRAASWVFNTNDLEGATRWFRQGNPVRLAASDAASYSLWAAWSILVVAVSCATVVSIARRDAHEPPNHRRRLRPFLLAALVVAAANCVAPISAFPERLDLIDGDPVDSIFHGHWYTELITVAPALAVAIIGGLLFWHELVRPRLGRLTDSTMQLEPQSASGSGLSGLLQRALGDATARVLFPRDGTWVDADGRAAEPATDPDRAATIVTRDGTPVAAVEHDRLLLLQPDLVDVAVASVGLALEGARLAAVAKAATDEIQSAAVLVLDAADRARETIQRQIDDGPRRTLTEVRDLLGARPIQFDVVHQRIRNAVAQLREIAHGTNT